jgi:hypothetical protein
MPNTNGNQLLGYAVFWMLCTMHPTMSWSEPRNFSKVIVKVDAAPFKQWYLQHYDVDLGRKKKAVASAIFREYITKTSYG